MIIFNRDINLKYDYGNEDVWGRRYYIDTIETNEEDKRIYQKSIAKRYYSNTSIVYRWKVKKTTAFRVALEIIQSNFFINVI